ncbi:hypothetical protein IWX49DRAFT_164147 [Phyllosticta citricarpa]|uniref:Uncharacterized protein n=1 Tax=Phyllosticta citricarpa TaxID=55181 RepID=A0ABR1MQK2_9PEZI
MLRNITNVAQISTNATYKIVNSWDLAPLSINPSKPNLQLHTVKRDQGLDFQFRTSEEPDYFNICAGYQNQTWCLDVFAHNKETPHLSPFGYHSGQYWKITLSNGLLKLSNQFTGLDYFLDVLSGSDENFMSTGNNYVGQYWMLDHVADNVILPLDAPEESSGSSQAVQPQDNISHAAIIGITVAATTAAVLLIVGLVLCFMRYRRKRLRRRPYGQSRPAPKVPTNMVQKNLQMTDSDVNLTRLSPLPSALSSTITTSAPTPNAPTLNLRLAHELESPQSGTIPRNSIYELPSEDMGYRGDSIEEVDLADTIRAPPPPPPPPMEPEEKTAPIVVAPPPPPSQPSSQASARGHARWEEIVPDGNGEITLDGTTLRPELFTNRSLFREEDGAIRRRPDIPGMGNLCGIAYGFGGGGGMAGSVAPGFEGSAASIMARKARESSRTRDTEDGDDNLGRGSRRRQDSRSQQPPAYDGPSGAFEADGKPILEMPATDFERRILEWGRRSG